MWCRRLLSLIVMVLAATCLTSIVQAQEDQATADDYLKYVRSLFPGQWRVQLIDAEDNVVKEGTIEFKVGPGQTCALSIGEGETPDMVNTGIHGYDPASKSWRVLQFAGDGSMLEMRVTIEKDVLTGGKFNDVTYTHRNTLTKPDGNTEKSRWKATIKDRNLFVLEQQSGARDQRMKMRFERQKVK